MNKDDTQASTVLTADDIRGPYTKVRTGLRIMSGCRFVLRSQVKNIPMAWYLWTGKTSGSSRIMSEVKYETVCSKN